MKGKSVATLMKVYKDNRITLPRKLLMKYDVSAGDSVLVLEFDNGLNIIPIRKIRGMRY